MKFFVAAVLHILLIFALSAPARAATVTWLPTSGTNDWSNTNNWSTTNVPAAGDEVIINYTNVGVLLTSSVGYFSSILLSNKCTLIFSNWDTSLSATNVTIQTNASMTLPAAFSNSWMSNNIYIVCSNLTIAAGGSINVDGRGYMRGNGPGFTGTGTGIGYRGGSYGGRGGCPYNVNVASDPYGSADAPFAPGSGGGAASGGNGGGAVRIEASNGNVTINGTISANGTSASAAQYGSGSGGAVYITCRTLAGTNGIVRANGAANGQSEGSGGGGGRISVVYNSAAQSTEPVPSVTFSASYGSSTLAYPGDIGTLYFPDNRFLTNSISHSGQWMVPGFTNWSVTNLTIANVSIGFPGEGFLLNVAGDLTITGAVGRLYLGSNIYNGSTYSSGATSGPTLLVGGNLIVTNGAQLRIFSGYSNDATAYGARVVVTGDVFVASGSSIFPYSQPTNGGSPLFTVRSNLTIAAGGAINALGNGYYRLLGPGHVTNYTGGGSYGGLGGVYDAWGNGGATYGNSNAPTLPGSGGGNAGDGSIFGGGGNGGGLVRIEAGGFIQLDGTINANGAAGGGNIYGGGGSGGGIFIVCSQFKGSGTNNASGGGGSVQRGGGGGGRIAVWHNVPNAQALTSRLMLGPMPGARQVMPLLFTGTNIANGGAGGASGGTAGANGTALFLIPPPPGTIFTIH